MVNYKRLKKRLLSSKGLLVSGAVVALGIGISSYIAGPGSSERDVSDSSSADARTNRKAEETKEKPERKNEMGEEPEYDKRRHTLAGDSIDTTLKGGIVEEAERYKQLIYGTGQGRVTFHVEERALRQIEEYIHLRRLNGHGGYSRDDLARLLYAFDGYGNNHVGAHEVQEYVQKERKTLIEKYGRYDPNFKPEDPKPKDSTSK